LRECPEEEQNFKALVADRRKRHSEVDRELRLHEGADKRNSVIELALGGELGAGGRPRNSIDSVGRNSFASRGSQNLGTLAQPRGSLPDAPGASDLKQALEAWPDRPGGKRASSGNFRLPRASEVDAKLRSAQAGAFPTGPRLRVRNSAVNGLRLGVPLGVRGGPRRSGEIMRIPIPRVFPNKESQFLS